MADSEQTATEIGAESSNASSETSDSGDEIDPETLSYITDRLAAI